MAKIPVQVRKNLPKVIAYLNSDHKETALRKAICSDKNLIKVICSLLLHILQGKTSVTPNKQLIRRNISTLEKVLSSKRKAQVLAQSKTHKLIRNLFSIFQKNG